MKIDGNLTATNLIKQGNQLQVKEDSTVKEPVDSAVISSAEFSKIGQLLAKTTFDCGVSVNTASEQRRIQKEGLASMVANSGTTQDEKTLAGLGITFGDHYMYDVSAARTRNVVLQTIIGGIGGAMGSVIAKVTYDAGVAVKTAEEQRAIQRQGFEAILANPDTTEEQKLLAQRGIDVGDHYMYDTSAAKARNIILQELFK